LKPILKLGYTGTRFGMTEYQKMFLRDFFRSHTITELRHGKCIGGDEDAHLIAWLETDHVQKIIMHPPIYKKFESKICSTEPPDIVELPAKGFLDRDQDIVNAVDMLLACPKDFKQLHSGTWYTINYAHKVGKPVIICV